MTSKQLINILEDGLEDLKEKGLYNVVDTLDGPNGPEISIKGQKLINLSSNNYLGFATDSELIEAANKATEEYGVGAGAVRSINGTLKIHDELEATLAQFKATEATLALQSGFNANMAAIPAIMTKKDAILSDELNHASIIEGCRLSGAKIIRVKHQDMEDLRAKAKEAVESGEYEKVMYITDGVFSMDGNIAKLDQSISICEEFDIITYVDDAHGSGVMGKGAGTVKHFGLQDHVDIQMGTLSKAIGVVGGYIAGKQVLIDWLKVRGRPFLFSTSLTPGAAAAAKAAVEKLMASDEAVQQLWDNANYLKKGLKDLGFDTGISESPITPVIIGDENKTQTFSKRLKEEGVYAKAIVFPTVPRGTGRVRNMPSAAHTKEQLDRAIEIYEKVGKELEII